MMRALVSLGFQNVQFSYLQLKSTLRFFEVEVIAFLSACLVNDLRPLETIQAIFEWKERFDATSLPSGKLITTVR